MTTLLAKANSFLEHACGNPLRYVLKAPSEPQTYVSHFSGSGFTQNPDFCNPQTRIIKVPRQTNAESLPLLPFNACPYQLYYTTRKEVGQFLC